jgi:hypothetical protein
MQSCSAVDFVAVFASAVSVGSSVLPNCLTPEAVLPLVFDQLVLVVAVAHVETCCFSQTQWVC